MILPGQDGYREMLVRPYVNSTATAVVEFIAYNYVILRIKMINGVKSVEVPAVIHREDALYGIKDDDKLNELFSPGDTVHGRVLSLGESGNIVLSTADESHGVVKAMDYGTLQEVKLSRGKFVHKGKELKRKTAIL
ncbi:exosome complex component CSL4 [Nematocida minor]|uniref:exosome complex component CSL4 n=1 Tax=Nematocida minor TaxID=1912983 RepID=UPI00221F755C|nr:exosome complex component CSL4 [Nematocida minor]KAI5192936.1 exosome complex component CSL4 [Nematocida minor]